MKLINADCIQAMKEMPDNSVDSIVTDPPYELGFMGKSWDSTGIAFNVAVWSEALRVLKPGGHLIAFSGSRTYHRMAVAIEDAGFEIRDQIQWVYGSGFPKSMDVSKAIDKGSGENKNRQIQFVNWMRSTGITSKQINDATNTQMASHYIGLSQPAIAVADLFDKLRPYLPEVPEEIERLVAERTGIEWTAYKKREITGKYDNPAPAQVWMDNYDLPADLTIKERKDKAHSPQAQQWQGWGTALKPAHEPMVLARKSVVGTVANNVLTYGVGGLNIDASRVGDGEDRASGGLSGGATDANLYQHGTHGRVERATGGRWPANFIHDGSDEVVELFPDSKSPGRFPKNSGGIGTESGIYGKATGRSQEERNLDSGSAARFFYCAKTSKRDRNEGLDDSYAKQVDESRKPGSKGGNNPRNRGANERVNHHPTVKPTSLMQYLVRLVTPQGGTVLDPFMGSGSTGKACAYEGFDFVGIDQSTEYVEIARARINFALENLDADI